MSKSVVVAYNALPVTIRLIEDKTSRHDEHDDGPAAGEGTDTCLLDADADASPSSAGFRLLREPFAATLPGT